MYISEVRGNIEYSEMIYAILRVASKTEVLEATQYILSSKTDNLDEKNNILNAHVSKTVSS